MKVIFIICVVLLGVGYHYYLHFVTKSKSNMDKAEYIHNNAKFIVNGKEWNVTIDNCAVTFHGEKGMTITSKPWYEILFY